MVEEALICPSCGHHNPPEARFCLQDGVPLKEGDPGDPLVGRLVGNYRLKKRIGEGGFGVVYLAEHREMQTEYAVKILHPQFSANDHVAERFRREAKAAGRLRHENVVHIADFGQAQGIGYFYVMEFLRGKTLKEALDAEEAFPPERILNIARQVTSAMERVHELQIIHRDLKPENIFLVENSAIPDHVKLVDFGIAKMLDDGGASLTRTGLSVGTPLYMSPEQARGMLRELDKRSDIYSWGIILFELLTYQPPFFSENPHDVVMLQIRGRPPRLSDTHPYRRFSAPIEEFFQLVLSKSPDERPSTMTELYQVFEPLLLASDAFYDDMSSYNSLVDLEAVSSKEQEAYTSHSEPLSSPFAMAPPLDVEEAEQEASDKEQLALEQHTDFSLGRSFSDSEAGVTSIDSLPANRDPIQQLHEALDSGERDVSSFKSRFSSHVDLDAVHTEGAPAVLDSSADTQSASAPVLVLDEPDIDLDELDETVDIHASELADEDSMSLSPVLPSEAVDELRSSSSVTDTSEALLRRVGTGSLSAVHPAALSFADRHGKTVFFVGLGLLGLLGAVLGWSMRETGPSSKKSTVAMPHTASTSSKVKLTVRRKPSSRSLSRAVPLQAVPRAKAPKVRIQPSPRPISPSGIQKLPTKRAIPRRLQPKKSIVTLIIRTRPRATCYVRSSSSRRKLRIGHSLCRVRAEYGATKYIWIQRRGYRPAMRVWTASRMETWTIRLRSLRRNRKRGRSNVRKQRPTPPSSRTKMDDIFGVAPNPFKKKK